MYRSKRLLDAARGQECMVQIPGICTNNPETVVAAHSNQLRHGKGGGLKAHDCFIAWACYSCHAELDQGKMSKNAITGKLDLSALGFKCFYKGL
jgi:hypothetical protein